MLYIIYYVYAIPPYSSTSTFEIRSMTLNANLWQYVLLSKGQRGPRDRANEFRFSLYSYYVKAILDCGLGIGEEIFIFFFVQSKMRTFRYNIVKREMQHLRKNENSAINVRFKEVA